MKDKEKQIEEMAKDLEEVETDVGHILVNETFSYVKEHKKYNPKKDFSNAHTKTFEELTAEEMFKKGYQKIDKNSVVLTKEELNQIINQTKETEKNYYKRVVIPQARKEMAEKFYKKVRKLLKKVDVIVDGDEGLVGYEESAVDKGLTEIAKQYGVEIKE